MLPMLLGDKLRLQQVLTILLDDAFTSCKHGSLILILVNYDGNHINVSIQSEARKENEFGEPANKRHQLGIEICQKIVERNKGNLELRFKSKNKCTVKFSMQMFEVDSPRQYLSDFSYLGN